MIARDEIYKIKGINSIKMQNNLVIISPDKDYLEKTKSGIILEARSHKLRKDNLGVIVGLPNKNNPNLHPQVREIISQLQVGQKVLYDWHAGQGVILDGEDKYEIIRVEDISCIIEEDSDENSSRDES